LWLNCCKTCVVLAGVASIRHPPPTLTALEMSSIAPLPEPGPLEDANSPELILKLSQMTDNDKHVVERPFGSGECNRESFTILTTPEYTTQHGKPKIDMKQPKACLKCGAFMEMIYKTTTSDGGCGVYYMDYICSNDFCRLLKEQKIEAYETLDV
jgi:hypothetical protein